MDLLVKAVGLYADDLKLGSGLTNPGPMILSRIQTWQDMEFHGLIESLQNKVSISYSLNQY